MTRRDIESGGATNGSYPVQQGGKVALPDRPGLGIEVDFAAFARRTLKRSSPGAAR
jgi:L-alanine-DL-glutamate epimerase-like enolase superfamily enzyme